MANIYQYGDNLSLANDVPDVNIVEVPPQVSLTGADSNIVGLVGVGSWGPLNTPVIVSGIADGTPALGNVKVRKHDIMTAVAIGQPQGSNDYHAVRVSDGTDAAAQVVIPSADLTASPSFWVAFASAANLGQGVLRGASQFATIDPATGTLKAAWTGSDGNGCSVSVGLGAKLGTYRGVIRKTGQQPEVYDNLAAATAPTIATYAFAGGTDGDAVTSAQLVGADVDPPTGIYALRGQRFSPLCVVDLDDSTQWTTIDAFAKSEGGYAIHQVPFGTTIPAAIALKNSEGLDSRYSKLMHGNALYWPDNVNGLIRLVSPSSFAAAKIAALQPNQSPLNKPLAGIVGSLRSGAPGTGSNGQYSRAELAALSQAGIDIITNPGPRGPIWCVRIGHNTSSNGAIRQDAATTMNNFLAMSIADIMGIYVGEDITLELLQEITAALNTFGANLLAQGLLGQPNGQRPYTTLCDATNNPLASSGQGFVRASFRVNTQAILEDFEIDLEDGPTVVIGSDASDTSAAA